mgnify:FL=1
MGVVELDGIYTLQDKLLNTDSANFCIEKGLPVGTETPCFRTWQWTYMTSTQSVLIPRPKNTRFSCLSISTLSKPAAAHSIQEVGMPLIIAFSQ